MPLTSTRAFIKIIVFVLKSVHMLILWSHFQVYYKYLKIINNRKQEVLNLLIRDTWMQLSISKICLDLKVQRGDNSYTEEQNVILTEKQTKKKFHN